ncbi:MAG TPA: hypothetical protein EYP98_03905 [Planctomycetes bacterium]|nr:hypothetical protein [Planctomycetota bacterium]
MPSKKRQSSLPQPPAGGCSDMATTAFTIGAPAKMIDITAAGWPLAPNASSTPNAPTAPTAPATSDSPMALPGIDHDAFAASNMPAGASTAIKKYAIPTQKKAL